MAKIKPYEDIVYHEPMNEEDIEAFQRRVGVKFKSSFKQFLQYIGLVQDLIGAINVDEESIMEHYDFIKEAYENYLPIHFSDGFEEDDEGFEEDRLLLINNNSEDDDWLYALKISDDDEIGELQNTGNTFSGLIENSYDELIKTKEERVKNEEEPVTIDRVDSKFNALEALIQSTGVKNEKSEFGIINLE